MNRAERVILILAIMVGLVRFTHAQQGPFGFEKGMTQQQIIQLVGSGAVDTKFSRNETLVLNTAPKPNPAFEKYMLLISPTQGLVKLVAIGTTIETGDSGVELQSAFADIVMGISQKYGSPSKKYDVCSGNDTECSNSEFWMMSLKDKNRTLDALWLMKEPASNSVTGIAVDAQVASLHSGFMNVSFEFAGFSSYAEARKAKQNDTY